MLSPSDRRLITWIEAAAWSLTRRQLPAAQRLLVIAIDTAVRAGYPELAENLQTRLLQLNANHHLARYASLTDAFESEDFQKFVSSVKRQISFEEAERLLDARPADDRLLVDDWHPIGPQLAQWLDSTDTPSDE